MEREEKNLDNKTQAQQLLLLLENLKDSPTGIVIYDQLARVLEDWHGAQTGLDRAYSSILSILLHAYSNSPKSEIVAEINARMIESRISPSTCQEITKILPGLLDNINEEAGKPNEALVSGIEAIAKKLMGNLDKVPAPENPQNQTTAAANPEKPCQQTPATEDMRTNYVDAETHPAAESKVNSAYRLHLDKKHVEIAKLQEELEKKAREAIAQNREFGSLLEIELSALQQANGIEEIADLKQILIGGTKELISGQKTLSEKLNSSVDYLNMVKSDSAQLRDELNKVRLLSLTDEFTGLPNRRAFIRRLEDEIGRAQRYETPLSLALLDLDEFKLVNDSYGHAAGDEVLCWYGKNALSIFRHHDMVARYGGEEFSVLLPNTHQEGALRALNKVRNRIQNVMHDFGGINIRIPTFSTGLTLYSPGETPSALIERADKALYRAKRMGRNRVEVELPNTVVANMTT